MTNALIRLAKILAALYPDSASTRLFIDQVGINTGRIFQEQQPATRWWAIVTEADKAGLVHTLIDDAIIEYPASNELRLLRASVASTSSATDAVRELVERPLLVAAIGSDAALSLDLAALRAVRTHTGLEFVRILDATLAKLKVVLDRERAAGRHANVHLAVHSGPQGVLLGGELVGPVQLSEVLDGVNVLLIAGCQSSEIGDFLGIVPFTVSMSEDVSHTDASLFSRFWWTAIGNGKTPREALEYALSRSPSGLGEMVVKSW